MLIVDDSALMRKLLSEVLESDRSITVLGTAVDAYSAREKIKKLEPDVLTLDVAMPRMNGVDFLKKLMRLRPMPVIMVSSMTESNAEITIEALEVGAVDFVRKPDVDRDHSFADFSSELISKVKMARGARVRSVPGRLLTGATTAAESEKPPFKRRIQTNLNLVAIGASTGGTEAIREILEQLPADSPPIMIVQHIPREFSLTFTRRMDDLSAMTVVEAQPGMTVSSGLVYVAPGDRHLTVERHDRQLRCKLSGHDPVNYHRPSVDVLFRSLARNVGADAVGVLLTGMGADGARGLRELRDAGAKTIAQDEETSVIWGMPGEAVKLGAAELVLPLPRITAQIAFLAKTLRGTVPVRPSLEESSGKDSSACSAT